MLFFKRKRHAYKTIDAAIEREILKLHKDHPEHGRKRLHAILSGRGIEVDAFELKHFLRSRRIGTPPPTRQSRPGWGGSHVPRHPWVERPR